MAGVRETSRLEKGCDSGGNKTVNQYAVLYDIGQGSYGKVKLAVDTTTDELRALKVIKRSILKRLPRTVPVGDQWNGVLREIAILKKLRHPSIVRLVEVIDDSDSAKIYLVLEYLEHGPLMTLDSSGKGEVKEVATIRTHLVHILSGLEYLHAQGIVHRDIKPDNLLLNSNGVVKINDFGVSTVETSFCEATRSAGTPAFTPPELFSDSPTSSPSTAVDIWAVGVTTYAMAYGELPFFAPTFERIRNEVLTEPLPTPHADLDGDLRELIETMLHKNPLKRATIASLAHHPFLTAGGPGPAFPLDSTAMEVTAEEIGRAVTELHLTEKVVLMAKVKARMKKRHREAQEALSKAARRKLEDAPTQ